jgi:mannosyltransferase OCH1-like enzyme
LSTVSGPIVNHGCLTILGGFSDTAGVDCISIKLDDMDELAKPSTAILLMKVDVEGFEPEVIEGANNLLKSGKVKFILIEISPKFRSINDYTKMVLNLVVNHYTIITDCATCEPINYDELICQLQSLPRGQNDYLFELNNEESNKEIIPKKIFQTWHTKELSKQMNESIQLLKISHPDFQHFLFDIEDCRRFIIENFEKAVIEAYDNLIPYAYKCDLWKYCVLYKFGGIYLDIKYKFCNNFHLNYLINREHLVLDRLGYAAPNHYTIQNGFIISKPGNPILLDCIENIVKNVQNNFYGFSSLYPTGPGLIG